MTRPTVHVVVPFAGGEAQLEGLLARLSGLRLASGDSLVVADNRPGAVARPAPSSGGPAVVPATGEGSPPHARNRGAAAGTAEWLVFLDSDVEAPEDIVERYFAPYPAPGTGILAGAIADEAAAPDAPPALRYAHLRRLMSHESTLGHGRWAFPLTANCAVRRCAFEAVGGFVEGIFIGEDADLHYRLMAAGWGVERREAAAVVHRNRATVRGMLRQRAVHGAATAWVNRAYPGSFPRRRWSGLVLWSLRRLAAGAVAGVRGDRDEALLGLLDPAAMWAFELGRLGSNRPRW